MRKKWMTERNESPVMIGGMKMLSKNSLMMLGLLFVGISLSLTTYASYAWMTGFVLVLTGAGMVKKKFITTKDLNKVFSLNGIGTVTAFVATIVFGARLFAVWIDAVLPYVGWVQLEWLFPIGLFLVAISAIEFTSKR